MATTKCWCTQTHMFLNRINRIVTNWIILMHSLFCWQFEKKHTLLSRRMRIAQSHTQSSWTSSTYTIYHANKKKLHYWQAHCCKWHLVVVLWKIGETYCRYAKCIIGYRDDLDNEIVLKWILFIPASFRLWNTIEQMTYTDFNDPFEMISLYWIGAGALNAIGMYHPVLHDSEIQRNQINLYPVNRIIRF